MARKPRTHDSAIQWLRKRARQYLADAEVMWSTNSPNENMLLAAALETAADHLHLVTGVVERKPRLKKPVSIDPHKRVVR